MKQEISFYKKKEDKDKIFGIDKNTFFIILIIVIIGFIAYN